VTAEHGRIRRTGWKSLAVATGGAMIFTAAIVGAGDAVAADSGPITGLGGKCVDVAAAGTANGTPVQLYDCNGTNAQNWTVGDSDHTVRALGKCMDVASAGTTSGAKVQLDDCNGTTSQQWTHGNGELINTGSGKCLDVTDKSTANGNQLQIWSCTGASNQIWTLPGGAGLDPTVAPGGNFDLSVWALQLPIGSPGSPITIPPSQLMGPNGYTNASYFWTDKNDGSMTFWAPESGVTTPNSKYARSELREMNPDGSAADWSLSGTHRLSATLRVVSVTSNVCVGQIHLGSGGPSTKPLLELYYHANGDVVLGLENSPDGGQTTHTLTNVPLGTRWSYVIAIVGGKIQITVNGNTTSYPISPAFSAYHQYFKAGDYNQSSSDSTTKGAKVKFYALTVAHG
jgi:Alginate lyase/Ricin-type beta-trefoil lectin domain